MHIQQVKTGRDLRAFIELPYRLYKDNPVWVPPLRGEQKKNLTPQGNTLLQHSDYAYYLLYDEGRVIGRIAAMIDHVAVDFWKEPIGFFGSYECIESQEGATLLLEAARGFLQERGMKEMRGPINMGATEWGFVVKGYEYPPMILSPYNPPYYNDQVLHFGMEKAKDLWAFEADTAAGFAMPERFTRLLDKLAERYNVTVRPADMKELERDTWAIADIMNKTIAYNWGATPISKEESIAMARDMKQIIDPNLVLLAEVEGKPIGFCLSLPDVNALLKGLNGHLFPRGIFRLLFGLKNIKRYRVWALGILPEYHGKGLDTLLYARTYGYVAERKGYAEVNYILEDNAKMLNPMLKMGIEHHKTYRVYTMGI